MVRTIRIFVLTASLLGFASFSFAQDPVTERPQTQTQTQPQPKTSGPTAQPQPKTSGPTAQPQQAQPQQPAAPAAQPLVTLEGREEWGNNGALTFQLFANGKVTMIDATQKPVQGTYRSIGNRLTLTFGNCVYDATENNGVVVGRASYTGGPNAGTAWNFRVALRNPFLGRTFAGQETLQNYGAVSFRFLNANTVEMTDSDGVTRGTYVQNGLQVTMTFGAAIYTGDLRGNAIAGTARNTNSSWTFQVNAK